MPPTATLDWTTFAVRLAATLFFVALNGFFVAAEFALVKARAGRLDMLASAGDGRARTARHIHARLEHYLSACQLGITIASLILGWLAEPAVAELLLALAGRAGIEAAADDPVLHALALGIALVVITSLHMIFGEQAPKIWAIRRAETTSLQVARPLRAFAGVFRPFIWSLNAASNAVLRALGLSHDELAEGSHSVEELQYILATSAEAGHITARQREFAQNILGIMNLEVRHIMVPRVDVAFLSLQSGLEENLRVLHESGHSRLPLCRVGLDTVVGVVHAKDVMRSRVERPGEPVDLEKMARRPVFVSDTQPVSRLILMLQRARSHASIVVDEHGTAVGMAFLEDALEEIVGPIQDEFDQEPKDFQRLGNGTVEMTGSLSLPEAADVLGLAGLGDEADTIGGHVTALLGRLPRQGDQLEIGPYRVEVVETLRRRVGKLRFERRSTGEPEAGRD